LRFGFGAGRFARRGNRLSFQHLQASFRHLCKITLRFRGWIVG
jgi:hypothetical protein